MATTIRSSARVNPLFQFFLFINKLLWTIWKMPRWVVFVSSLYVLNLLPNVPKFNHFHFQKSSFHAHRGDYPLVGIIFLHFYPSYWNTRTHRNTKSLSLYILYVFLYTLNFWKIIQCNSFFRVPNPDVITMGVEFFGSEWGRYIKKRPSEGAEGLWQTISENRL